MQHDSITRKGRERVPFRSILAGAFAVALTLIGTVGRTQDEQPSAPPQPSTPAPSSAPAPQAGQPDDQAIQLTFPDNVELKTVLDYVAVRLGINIIYDEKVASQRVTIRSPDPVPPSRLLPLLRSTLHFRGFILTKSNQGDWFTVRPAENLARQSEWMQDASDDLKAGNQVITTILTLQHIAPEPFRKLAEPFLTAPGGNLLVLPGGGGFVVTDYSRVIETLRQLRQHADQPGIERGWKVYRLENASAMRINQTLQTLIQAKPTLMPTGDAGKGTGQNQTQAVPIGRIDAFLLTGTAEQIRETEALLSLLDVPRPVRTRLYELEHTTAGRAARLLSQMTRPLQQRSGGESWVISSDPEGNALVVTCPAQAHDKIQRWLDELIDRPLAASPTGISTRVFPVKYARAPDLAETLEGVFAGGATAQSFDFGPSGNDLDRDGLPTTTGMTEEGAEDAVTGDATTTEQGSTAVDSNNSSREVVPPREEAEGYDTSGINRIRDNTPDSPEQPRSVFDPLTPFDSDESESPVKLTVDEATNSIIATGPPSYLTQVERLIERLDHHRPQVLIEATIVSMSSSDNLDLGVDIQYLSAENNQLESGVLSNFGLLDVDPVTGATTATLGSGLTAVLLRSDEVSVILRALQTKLEAKIVAKPRLLVADNETGVLESINEQPFTSINAGETVSTTSFGGYVEAGTQLILTPNISESDVVHLEYDIRSSSFTGAASDPNLPPPRALDSVTSHVTIPSGYTLLVGGLTRRNHQRTQDQVPILGDLPLVGVLFQSLSDNESETILYVFLRPVIHREDRFAYLRYQSANALEAAGIESDAPELEMEYLT